MNTKLVDNIKIEQSKIENEYKKSWLAFLKGDVNTHFEETFTKVEALLNKNPWVVMNDNFVYDNKIKACWYGLANEKFTRESYLDVKSGTNLNEVLTTIKKQYRTKHPLDIPRRDELLKSLAMMTIAPFSLKKRRPDLSPYCLYQINNKVQGFDLDNDYMKISDKGIALPILRLVNTNNFSITNRIVFFRWLVLGLIPKELKNDKDYNFVLKQFNNYEVDIVKHFEVIDVKLKQNQTIQLSASEIVHDLLIEDKLRADIKPYNEKMLDDIEQGHWSLWADEEKNIKGMVYAKLNKKLVARDPKSSIVDGTIGIDFGTKSTVVVYQKDTTKIHPMRIGTGDLSQSIAASHYENPTIMELNDFEIFINDYKSREGRPYTKWEDITISHTANNSLLNSKSDYFNSFVSELKQWAGNKNKKLKIKDKKDYVLDLEPFMELKDDDINPIELYAYYLGLYINNQQNGIYMNYILSFPVTYEVEIRDKIIESFKKGITKSLPQELHDQEGEIEKLSILKGTSEPAAYAVVALQEYQFDPCDNEKVFYGVFDFGGGTTDFDFGIYREANGAKERRYDYAIEHFGAGGDRYLGGENILELLSFEIFKANKEKLLKESIQFILPPECDEFLGSETLLSLSREAKLNTTTLMEKIRPFWENVENKQKDFDNGVLEVNLTNIDGKQLTSFALDFDKEKISKILYDRIEKGVDNFFESLRMAFDNYDVGLNSIDKINIFLAGNSSKSHIVSELFDKKIKAKESEIKQELASDEENIFKIHPPLGSDDNSHEKPTGKTGVAFGLIETRKGGDILVIDHNIKNTANISFKFYLGESRKKKFKVLIDRDVEQNKWIEFVDASVNSFELYYSSQSIVSTNKTPIGDSSIKKMIIKIDTIDEDALVYIRVVSPSSFEYVVASEDGIKNDIYLGNTGKINIEG